MNDLPEGDVGVQKEFLRNELEKVKPILNKLPGNFTKQYMDSQKSFAEHVFKSNASLLAGFFNSRDGEMGGKIFGEEEETGI